VFVPDGTLQLSRTFVGKAEAYPSGAPL